MMFGPEQRAPPTLTCLRKGPRHQRTPRTFTAHRGGGDRCLVVGGVTAAVTAAASSYIGNATDISGSVLPALPP